MDRNDVLDLLTSVVDRAVASCSNGRGSIAIHVKGLVRRIYRHGLILPAVSHNPVDLLPTDLLKAARPRPKKRVLTDEEIRTLWPAWASAGVAGAAFQVLLLTGQRPHIEVGLMRWSEIHEDSWWQFVSSKTEKENRIYLTPLTMSLLPTSRKDSSTDGFVFAKPGQPDKPVDLRNAVKTIRSRSGITDWAPHDLRRTAATGWAHIGVDEKIIEIILNHGPRNTSQRHYIWWKYQDQVQQALIQWSDYLAELCGL